MCEQCARFRPWRLPSSFYFHSLRNARIECTYLSVCLFVYLLLRSNVFLSRNSELETWLGSCKSRAAHVNGYAESVVHSIFMPRYLPACISITRRIAGIIRAINASARTHSRRVRAFSARKQHTAFFVRRESMCTLVAFFTAGRRSHWEHFEGTAKVPLSFHSNLIIKMFQQCTLHVAADRRREICVRNARTRQAFVTGRDQPLVGKLCDADVWFIIGGGTDPAKNRYK